MLAGYGGPTKITYGERGNQIITKISPTIKGSTTGYGKTADTKNPEYYEAIAPKLKFSNADKANIDFDSVVKDGSSYKTLLADLGSKVYEDGVRSAPTPFAAGLGQQIYKAGATNQDLANYNWAKEYGFQKGYADRDAGSGFDLVGTAVQLATMAGLAYGGYAAAGAAGGGGAAAAKTGGVVAAGQTGTGAGIGSGIAGGTASGATIGTGAALSLKDIASVAGILSSLGSLAAGKKGADELGSPPEAPTLRDPYDDPAVEDAANRTKRKNTADVGRFDTILTGPLGLGEDSLGTAGRGRKTILGG